MEAIGCDREPVDRLTVDGKREAGHTNEFENIPRSRPIIHDVLETQSVLEDVSELDKRLTGDAGEACIVREVVSVEKVSIKPEWLGNVPRQESRGQRR